MKMYLLFGSLLATSIAFAGPSISGGPMTLKIRCSGQNADLGNFNVSVASNYAGDPGSFQLTAQVSTPDFSTGLNRTISSGVVNHQPSDDGMVHLTGDEISISISTSSSPNEGTVTFINNGKSYSEDIQCPFNQIKN